MAGSVDFREDKLDLTCLPFGLPSHFSGTCWAEFRVGVGWATQAAPSQPRRGPQPLSGQRGTGQMGPTPGLGR